MKRSLPNPLSILQRNSPSTSTPSASQSNQPEPDLDYSDDINTIPGSLQPTFNNLKKAINDKKNILEQYKGLYATLQSMDGLLGKYITDHATTTRELDELKTEKQRLEKEKEDLINQPRTNPEDLSKIEALNQAIRDKESQIKQFEQQQLVNDDKMKAIGLLLEKTTTYINNMYPTDNTEITNIQTLIDQMKIKLGSVPVVQEPEVNFGDVYNPMKKGTGIGGYRYSTSSQMRRKSTARRSSSSGSSSSKRRRNKKRTAKKIMSGGKRMKKKRATKRKNHKKC